METTKIFNVTDFKKQKFTYDWIIEGWKDLLSLKKEFRTKTLILGDIDLPCYFFFQFDDQKRFATPLGILLGEKCDYFVIGLCAEKFNLPLQPINVVKCAVIINEEWFDFNSKQVTPSVVKDESVISIMYTNSFRELYCKLLDRDSLYISIEIEYGSVNNTTKAYFAGNIRI